MRNDAIGFFWENLDEKTEKKEKLLKENGWIEVRGRWYKQGRNPNTDYSKDTLKFEDAYLLEKGQAGKAVPPEPVWLEDDYLPHYEIAKNYKYNIMTDIELSELVIKKEPLVFDIECYRNYFLIAFKNYKLNKIIYFESHNDSYYDREKLNWILENAVIISFNGLSYDEPIAALAANGKNNKTLKLATNDIIRWKLRPYEIYAKYKCRKPKYDHIDIKEVAPLSASLKIYGGRVHSKRMQDLPFPEDVSLSEEQAVIVKWYCINDLDTTEDLRLSLVDELLLRYNMSRQYQTDLRSKSDAQIAEAVIKNEYKRLMGHWPKKIELDYDEVLRYDAPANIKFSSDLLNWVLQVIKDARFHIGADGKPETPASFKDLKFDIGETTYQMGKGGLHSCEKAISHYSDDKITLKDRDIASNYPRIILNQGLFPPAIGRIFLQIYNTIVETRLRAKANGDKVIADSLKIVINGTFGKFGSHYSIIYAPKLMLQTTLSGQLYLLMLVERFELAGISVVSANTDGIVFKSINDREDEIEVIVKQWEIECGFESEETIYKSLHSANVNNYIAISENEETVDVKRKGLFKKPGLHKNPTATICSNAVVAYLAHGAPITHTVTQCQRVQEFVAVRTVNGGAVKDGEFLGKAIRWYYSKETDGNIIYAKSGNKVPKSDGAKPLMVLSDELPKDLDYDWYINEAYKMLDAVGLSAT